MVVYGCGSSSNEAAQADDNSTVEESADEITESTNDARIDVRLSGVYVTSIKTPHDNFDYENLFDGDENTFWATMPGAGPDEGIMLYFQNPQDISHLQIMQNDGSDFSRIQEVEIYTNGQSPIQSLVSNEIKIDKQDVTSLYIRIIGLKDIEMVTSDDYINQRSFDNSKSAAISELMVYSGQSKLSLIAPRKMDGKVNASSTLAPEISYGVQNLFDSRKEFAWAEGAKTNGENETISIELNEKIQLSGLKINNGYQRSDSHYKANTRVKSISISNEAGQNSSVVFDDIAGEQMVEITTPLEGAKFTLTIDEVYPGDRYKDLVISEMKLVSDGQDIIIKNNIAEGVKSDLYNEVKGTLLGDYVDIRKANSVEEIDGYSRSIILRSDFTFVAYNKSWSDDGFSEKLIADGNWEIKNIGEDNVKVRVFGKLTRISETIDYYAGNAETKQQQIFQDFLTITSSGIKGEKFIPEIKNITKSNE